MADPKTYTATCSAPVNIAVIKYWGKRDTSLILPTNDSLSVTLDQDHLRSVTTASASAAFEAGDRLWLNGIEEQIKDSKRLLACIQECRKVRKSREEADASLAKMSDLPLHICSENNFPTAAGLASSASGFAALVATLASLYSLQPTLSTSDLSRIARQGSGSACRSLFGGFVAWQSGTSPDGSDSLAVEVAPKSHWPSLQALICVVSDAKKGTPSTAGMQQSVATSPLLQHRIKNVVPGRMVEMGKAVQAKDFDLFAEVTMNDSNNFHACALDTSPPIFYMNDTSRAIVQLIEEYNRSSIEETGKRRVAYTYDAGPNAVLYAEEKEVPTVLALVRHYFPNADFDDTFNLLGAGANASHRGAQAPAELPSGLPKTFNKDIIQVHQPGSVRRLIHTRVGDGPRTLHKAADADNVGDEKESLVGPDGLPLRLQRAKRV
ncbi:putative MVD1-mevalonate pyrophosphate decarboxylase [Acaromyces ingoldii]|uniref:Diphosphomevalonate decarboxylase n=1 Tax=Acaromyces ingoldii TaxID=215250 RepID=A0A316YH07_9BASI|nr:putative MVD1-mevalonate pyrophosphate decarboxylase [Acaromyces ingoldii]PWN88134.1 putative MVD1-mevalonate pyrophosphate decarboxylase [Acaromyces ingoldii]